MSLQGSFDEARSQLGLTPKVVYEINENFDDLHQGTLQCRFNAIIFRVGGAGIVEYSVYVGGLINTVDGTLVATIETDLTTETQETDLGVSFTNPAMGEQLVKITAKALTSAAAEAKIRAAKYVIG
jgi:hypothetical protein